MGVEVPEKPEPFLGGSKRSGKSGILTFFLIESNGKNGTLSCLVIFKFRKNRHFN